MRSLLNTLRRLPEFEDLLLRIDAGRCPVAASGLSPVHRAFVAAGIALRCMGEADAPKLEALRAADEILQTAMADAGQRKHRMLYFAVLLDMPQTRENEEGGYVVALRVVQDAEQGHAPVARLSFDLLERISEEILSKLPQVRRVVYDLTACPPGQVEWA